LIAAEVFDAGAFEELKGHLCEKSKDVKQEHVVSKQVLSALLDAANVIESRAEYMPEVRQHQSLVSDFYILLGLIAIGEAWSDRAPGVPRVR
jgi:hypothetical protein